MVGWIVEIIPVIIATIIAYVIGMLWYSPILFGKQWLKLSKINPKGMKMGAGTLLGGLIVTFIFTFILAIVISWSNPINFIDGAIVGFIVWIGFIATLMFNMVLYQKKPMALYLIDVLHYLVILVINGGILAVWR